MKVLIACLALVGLSAPTLAAQTRDLEAHAHGHSTLDIAFDGTEVAMELRAPGVDIVGFEYTAATVADRGRIDTAIADLSEPLLLFVMPVAAGCTVTQAAAGLVLPSKQEHGGAQGDDAGRAEEAGHTEFSASYLLTCAAPAAIDRIRFSFFETFPNAEEIDIQMIGRSGSRGFEVGRDDPELDLAGQF